MTEINTESASEFVQPGTNEAAAAEMTKPKPKAVAEAIKPKRGRPKGSRNKPKSQGKGEGRRAGGWIIRNGRWTLPKTKGGNGR